MSALTSAWRRRPLVPASYALHAAAAAAVVARPAEWPWAAAAIVANHAVLTAVGLWPRSRGLGPNWTRLPVATGAARIALTIDDGPDPRVTPQVLEVLARGRVRATFFCVGERVEAEPSLAREIVAAGHRIENHSQRHLHRFSLLGPAAMREEVARAQESIATVTGVAPRFFRAPAGLRNPFLDGVLESLRLALVSWTRRGFDTVSSSADSVLARLTRDLEAGDILLLHDGHAGRTADGTPLILAVLPRLLEAVREAGLTPVTLRAACA